MIDLSANILYEDSDILAINKPAGLLVHPVPQPFDSAHGKQAGYGTSLDRETVSDWLVKKYPQTSQVGEPLGEIERPGVVHRIDRDTSGVLLLAKTKDGHTHLKSQFQNREIEKVYHAFVYGVVKDDRGAINKPIGRSSGDFRKRTVGRGVRGEEKEALTYFEVIKRDPEKAVTLLELKPKTGRTHQIRVHLNSIHHSVICDKLYAPKKECLLGFNRLALHARMIVFKDLKGGEVKVEAPYPEDFKRAITG